MTVMQNLFLLLFCKPVVFTMVYPWQGRYFVWDLGDC